MATYGSNVLTGGSASASSDRGGTTYAAAHAVDGNTATRWATDDGNVPGWWQYDLGAGVSKTVQKIGLNLQSSETTKDFFIRGSNDGTSWSVVYHGTGANNNSWQYYAFDNPTAYRYWRIDVWSIYAGAVCSISEIEMYERTDPWGPFAEGYRAPAAVAVSNDRGGGYAVGNSWDFNPNSRWASYDGVTAAWWRADFGSGLASVLTRIDYLLLSSELPNAFTIEGSNDGSAWTTLLSTNGANAQTWQQFTFANTTAYRYYRLNVSSVYAGIVVSLSEVLLWGTDPAVPAASGGVPFQAVIVG